MFPFQFFSSVPFTPVVRIFKTSSLLFAPSVVPLTLKNVGAKLENYGRWSLATPIESIPTG
jgi:hypothetical protein